MADVETTSGIAVLASGLVLLLDKLAGKFLSLFKRGQAQQKELAEAVVKQQAEHFEEAQREDKDRELWKAWRDVDRKLDDHRIEDTRMLTELKVQVAAVEKKQDEILGELKKQTGKVGRRKK